MPCGCGQLVTLQESLVTTLLHLFVGVWYLTECVYPYALLVKMFFKVGRGIRIVLLMYHMILVYDMVKSRAVRVIRDVYSVLFTCPGLG